MVAVVRLTAVVLTYSTTAPLPQLTDLRAAEAGHTQVLAAGDNQVAFAAGPPIARAAGQADNLRNLVPRPHSPCLVSAIVCARRGGRV